MWGMATPGIEQFKQGFGGREIRYIGAYDLVDLGSAADSLWRLPRHQGHDRPDAPWRQCAGRSQQRRCARMTDGRPLGELIGCSRAGAAAHAAAGPRRRRPKLACVA